MFYHTVQITGTIKKRRKGRRWRKSRRKAIEEEADKKKLNKK